MCSRYFHLFIMKVIYNHSFCYLKYGYRSSPVLIRHSREFDVHSWDSYDLVVATPQRQKTRSDTMSGSFHAMTVANFGHLMHLLAR